MTYANNSAYWQYLIERIKRRCIASGDCLLYQGNNGHKYGLISVTVEGLRRSVPAHRALYMASIGNLLLPRNVYVRHKCDIPRCCNIDHLDQGTPTDNMQDCIERKRRATSYKLHTRLLMHDNDKILAIRKATGSCKEVAYKYGVSVGYVSKIRNMKAKTLL